MIAGHRELGLTGGDASLLEALIEQGYVILPNAIQSRASKSLAEELKDNLAKALACTGFPRRSMMQCFVRRSYRFFI